jgi:FKBP-type peptidyl-prolyl cis-trans isomerase (trigger factor)
VAGDQIPMDVTVTAIKRKVVPELDDEFAKRVIAGR